MRTRAPLLVAIAAFILIIGVFFFFVRPRMKAVGEAREQLETAEQDEVGLRAELARLQEARDAAADVRRELARIRREVPPVADLPGLINQLQDAADASEVEFFSISPGDPTPAEGAQAARVPAEIRINGGFFAVDEFLFRLETLSRAAKVITISISPAATIAGEEATDTTGVVTTGGLQVTMSVEFYTKDISAGPGAPVADALSPTPGTSPSPGTTPSPGATSPAPTPTEGA